MEVWLGMCMIQFWPEKNLEKKKKNYELIKSIFSRKLAKFASLKYHLSQNKKRKYESRSSNFEGTSFWYRGDRFTV